MMTNQDPVTAQREDAPSPINQGRLITSGLITSDLKWLITLVTSLAIIIFLIGTLKEFEYLDSLSHELLITVAKLSVIPIIANRIRYLVSGTGNRLNLGTFLRSFILGFALVAASILPIIIFSVSNGDSTLQILAIVLLTINIGYVLKFCLFPIPFSDSALGLVDSIRITRSISNGTLRPKLLTLLSPFALFLLLSAIVAAISPSARFWFVIPLSEGLSSAAWILFIIQICALSLVDCSDLDWSKMTLGPYRTPRLATIAAQSSKWLTKQLTPRFALIWIGVAFALWSANTVRIVSEPPPQKVSVATTQIQENYITVRLNIIDDSGNFRGFHPMLFALGSANRVNLSEGTPQVESFQPAEGSPLNSRILTLRFLTTRKGEELQQVKDLYLWYAQVKLEKMDLSQATILKK